jgi:hypothetical protein
VDSGPAVAWLRQAQTKAARVAALHFGVQNGTRHGNCFIRVMQASIVCVYIPVQSKEGRIMNKATSTLIAAVAALALSGGAYAQAGGGSNGGGSTGSTASPANQVNGATSGYGTPGATNSDSGRVGGSPNSGLPNSTNSTTSGTPAPTSNNTLATPSVKSPAGGQ